MFHKIANVSPCDDISLLVEFVTGERRKYNVKQLFDRYEQFKVLSTPNLFKCVSVDTGGYGVFWNDYLDLSCNELWANGIPVDETQIA